MLSGCSARLAAALQPEGDAGQVDDQEDDGAGIAERAGVGCRRRVEAHGQGRDEEGADGQQEQRADHARGLGVEALGPVAEAAGHEGRAQHQEHVAEHRADQGGAHHIGQAVAQGEDADEQLGQVAEAGLEQAGGAWAQTLADLLDGLADLGGQGGQGEAGEDELGHIGDAGGLAHRRHRGQKHSQTDHDALGLGQGSEHEEAVGRRSTRSVVSGPADGSRVRGGATSDRRGCGHARSMLCAGSVPDGRRVPRARDAVPRTRAVAKREPFGLPGDRLAGWRDMEVSDRPTSVAPDGRSPPCNGSGRSDELRWSCSTSHAMTRRRGRVV